MIWDIIICKEIKEKKKDEKNYRYTIERNSWWRKPKNVSTCARLIGGGAFACAGMVIGKR